MLSDGRAREIEMKSTKTQLVYSIKYVETQGIEPLHVETTDDSSYAYHQGRYSHRRQEIIGRTCFFSREEAVKAGKKKIEKALRSLEKRKSKLSTLLESLE